MKKLALFAAGIMLPFITISQAVTDNTFTVKISMGEMNKPINVYLLYQAGGKRIIDSAEQKGGLHVLRGNINRPLYATLVADHDHLGLEELMQKGNAGVDFLSFYLHQGSINLKTTGLIADARFSGSAINSDNLRLQLLLKRINDKYKNISEQLMSTNDTLASHRLGRQLDSLRLAKKPILKEFILANSNSFIALVALQQYAGSFPDLQIIEPMFNRLSPAVKSTLPGREFYKFLTSSKNLVNGATAPEFIQNDTAGKPVRLSSFRGNYVLLDFWASWCGPCRQENPGLRQVYEDYKGRNFTILGISLDRAEGRNAWLQAIKDDGLAWTQVSDLKHWENQVAKLYGIRFIPQSFLIDPSGIIIARGLDHRELRKKLEEVLPAK